VKSSTAPLFGSDAIPDLTPDSNLTAVEDKLTARYWNRGRFFQQANFEENLKISKPKVLKS